MAVQKRKYYKTKSVAKTVLHVLIGLLIALVVGMIILFFSLKKYIVTDDNGLHLEVPFLMDADTDSEKTPEQAILIEK